WPGWVSLATSGPETAAAHGSCSPEVGCVVPTLSGAGRMTALCQRTLLARNPFSDKPDPLVQTRELFQVCDAIDDERELERVRAEIVVLNLGLADRIAGHYRNRGIPAEDLQQVAYVGLCKAVQ